MKYFINVIKIDPKVQIKKDVSDNNNKLPPNCQSKIGCDTSIQNVILKEMINLMSTLIVDLVTELKMKNGRIKCLENRFLCFSSFLSL